MGHVYQEVVLAGRRRKKVKALVDMGATWTVISRDLARELQVPKPVRREKVELADGTIRRLPMTVVVVRIDGREVGSLALIVPSGDPLIGVETLETLGLAVDPKRGTLVPTRRFTVRLGFYRRR